MTADFFEDDFIRALVAQKSVEKALDACSISPGYFMSYCREHQGFFDRVRTEIHGISSVRALDRYSSGSGDYFFRLDKVVGNASFVRELLRGFK